MNRMSQILKALNKAQKEHQHPNPPEGGHAETDTHSANKNRPSPISKILYLNMAICGVLIFLVIAGLMLNYSVSSKLMSTQGNMESIEKNLMSQQEQLNKNNDLLRQLETAHNAQRKEFSARIDQFSASVDTQLREAGQASRSNNQEMTKTIEQQQKTIEKLSKNYEQLNDSVRDYKIVNQKSMDEINALKQKLKELGLGQSAQ